MPSTSDDSGVDGVLFEGFDWRNCRVFGWLWRMNLPREPASRPPMLMVNGNGDVIQLSWTA